jgi:hypothetical protein
MNEKFFIYAITDSSVKKYYLSGQQLLSFYKEARVIRIATNQECVFLDNGTRYLWVDIDEQQITF